MAVEWRDEAIVLSARPHGETSLLVAVLSAAHGWCPGLVRGGLGKAARGLWQPGNRVQVTWKARLPEHLGTLSGEMVDAVAARVMGDAGRLAVLSAVCAVTQAALPEREPMSAAYADTVALLGWLSGPEAPADATALGVAYVLWERGVLTDLGFGLDLSACAATGTRDDLTYVSPKSGRAVSTAAGAPWRDRLLPLPGFLRAASDPGDASREDVRDGLRLTGFFLERHVFNARHAAPPAARDRLVARMERAATRSDDG
ncbi:DNA repair protein RecO [Roseospira marina]|uniref:DNA repair protein RecO n=1 Tax=Roseospira marina TaxID=140057 RepID=A0A5M6IA46_9PROT|nr:DNA repair protein RecO [Roseospira marina]KAA5604599.1 DNA repair protein RecO [Roseospira marina]MBB4315351.1 DNA repair protein RecO (recombination protein O) [Roseospira marina]MBB5088350.1 DNA repair protein RecO (recombination protein O) [Roseospira marina]